MDPLAATDQTQASWATTVFQAPQASSLGTKVWSVLALASAIAAGYHGVKRHNGSVGWGIAWFALGGLFPVITPVIALGQGFAKPMKG